MKASHALIAGATFALGLAAGPLWSTTAEGLMEARERVCADAVKRARAAGIDEGRVQALKEAYEHQKADRKRYEKLSERSWWDGYNEGRWRREEAQRDCLIEDASKRSTSTPSGDSRTPGCYP